MILVSAVLSQYTRVTDRQTTTDDRRRRTTSYRNSGTCNAIATFCYIEMLPNCITLRYCTTYQWYHLTFLWNTPAYNCYANYLQCTRSSWTNEQNNTEMYSAFGHDSTNKQPLSTNVHREHIDVQPPSSPTNPALWGRKVKGRGLFPLEGNKTVAVT